MKFKLLATIFAITAIIGLPQTKAQNANGQSACDKWVNTTMGKLTLEEKIGQLIVARVPTSKATKKQKTEFRECITKYKVGGLCFFAGKCDEQLAQTKEYQKLSQTPLLICLDAEWGLGMRLTDAYSFPRQMMMGALSNDTLVYKMAEAVALQCRKMGIHVNFAPCVDVNSNPMNPVIGARSFGENPENVARKSLLYVKGMQDNGIIAVAKHFPGHGNTDVDSHLDLPVLKQSKKALAECDLIPYKTMINGGVKGIMAAHLQVEAYEKQENCPSSLSKNIVTNLLRNELKYNGLVVSDGLDMKAVTKHYKNGEAELKALLAGVDVLLLPDNVAKAVEAIKTAAENDKDLQALIDEKCRKILQAKYQCGAVNAKTAKLSAPNKTDWQNCEDITSEIAENAITLIRNHGSVIPIDKLANKRLISINIGCADGTNATTFTNTVDRMAKCQHYFINSSSLGDSITYADSIGKCDIAIVTIYANAVLTNGKNYGVTRTASAIFDSVSQISDKVIVNILGSPYGINHLQIKHLPDALMIGYQNISAMQEGTAKAIFGGLPVKGILPVTANKFKEGTHIFTKKIRMGEKPLSKTPYNNVHFRRVDSLALDGIKQKAYPGCQILVAKDGDIIFNKSYGRMTYNTNSAKVDNSTMYDLASLTKVTATTFAVMKLVDAKKIKLTDKMSRYLPYLKDTDKEDITILEALSHCAGFQAFIPFWKDVVTDGSLDVNVFETDPENINEFNPFVDDIYVCKRQRDEVLQKIANSKLKPTKEYLYSDFGFILLADLVEHVSGQSLDIFMQQQFYEPLGMSRTTFNPLQNGFDKANIAPTENDTRFRKTQVHGTVHDENAALMGGVAGHAGLFSNATDIAKLFQMMLNMGTYGDHEYLSPEVIKLFNFRHFEKQNNRRALGFDKPLIKSKSTHCAPEASQKSFGHSGFTGTFVWVDPEYNLIYIFLSNRVYPDASTNKLAKLNIRTNIQSEIYKAINQK